VIGVIFSQGAPDFLRAQRFSQWPASDRWRAAPAQPSPRAP
jgi:hypothetical protein